MSLSKTSALFFLIRGSSANINTLLEESIFHLDTECVCVCVCELHLRMAKMTQFFIFWNKEKPEPEQWSVLFSPLGTGLKRHLLTAFLASL